MAECPQTQTQSVLDHGYAVASKFKDLIEGRTDGWRLPDWFTENREFLLGQLPDLALLEQYHVYHDCGKPYCRTVDAEGRQHFPDHARISASVYRVTFGDSIVATYIQHDMDFHLMKPADAHSYERLDLAPVLLLTALAELHSNASMFGGIESTSFKIKFKTLSKTGSIILNRLKENQNVQ